MARDTSGTYTLPTGNPVVTGTVISSTVHNATMADIEDELTDSLSRSGKGGMTSDLDMNSHKVTEVATPTVNTDATNKAYVDTATDHRSMGGYKLTNLATPANDYDAATKKYVDETIVYAVGTGTHSGNWNSTGTTYQLHKNGRLCTLYLYAVSTGAGDWFPFDIDVGFRPSYEHLQVGWLHVNAGDSGAFIFKLKTDGAIEMVEFCDTTKTKALAANSHFALTCTYLVAS